MAFLLVLIAVRAVGFALDLDRRTGFGLFYRFGNCIFLNLGRRGGGGFLGFGGSGGRFSSRGLLDSRLLAAFTVFVLAAVFAADLTVLILVLGASTEAASAGFSSALAAVFLAGAAAFLAAVFRVAGFWAADASGALVSDGFLAIKFQVKGRIMN
ncbi:MAG: hypothetical protein ACLSCR_05795 [Akkermansia sp.]